MNDVDRGRLGHGHVPKSFGVEPIEKQAGTAHTTGFDEGSPIHTFDL